MTRPHTPSASRIVGGTLAAATTLAFGLLGGAAAAQAATCDAATFASDFNGADDGDTVTLCGDLDLDTSNDALKVPSGKSVTLDLAGQDLTINAANGHAGIHVPSGAEFEVVDRSTDHSGSLDANGGFHGAGLGADDTDPDYSMSGSITITNAEVEATGGSYAAGIGGTWQVGNGTVTIDGGTVTAVGGPSGAGIGGGAGGAGGTVVINSGTVTATATQNIFSAAIGGGPGGAGADVTVHGGTVWAQGGSAGIGAGAANPESYGPDGGILTITGGQVTASGEGVGVGGGRGSFGINEPATSLLWLPTSGGDAGNVNVTGGTLHVTHGISGGNGGIGFDGQSGADGGDGPQLTISGGVVSTDRIGGGFGGSGDHPASDGSDGAFGSVTIEDEGTLTIRDGGVLTIPMNAEVRNDGLITGEGTLNGMGTLRNWGSISNSLTVDNQPGGLLITANNYALAFHSQGLDSPPTVHVLAPTLGDAGFDLDDLPEPSRDGYDFAGWLLDDDDPESALANDTGLPDGSSDGRPITVDLFAQWDAEEPTDEPTSDPTDEPTDEPSSDPTDEPTSEPTDEPTSEPTDEPTSEPTDSPTGEPTDETTDEPSEVPTPTDDPTEPEGEPETPDHSDAPDHDGANGPDHDDTNDSDSDGTSGPDHTDASDSDSDTASDSDHGESNVSGSTGEAELAETGSDVADLSLAAVFLLLLGFGFVLRARARSRREVR